MKLLTTMLPTLPLTLSAPLHPRQNIATNTASCEIGLALTQFGPCYTYKIHIGQPFNNGVGCEPVHQTMIEAVRPLGIDMWTCEDDGVLNTMLFFSGGHQDDFFTNQRVNDFLAEAYPMVPFREEGYCLVPENKQRS